MQRKIIKLSLCLSVCMLNAYSQPEYSGQHRYAVESNINNILSSFERYLNLEDASEDDMNKLLELEKMLDKDAIIHNFLDPSPSKSIQISAPAFVDYIRSNFISGLSTNLSWNIQRLTVNETQEMQVYSANIPVEITALGIHRSQKIVNISEYYYFIFDFTVSKSGISNFRLGSIQQKRPLKIRKSGNYLGFCATPLYSFIYSKNIFSDNNWDASGKFGYHFSISYNQKINDQFSLTTGIGLSNYHSEYHLTNFTNENINTIERIDSDQDTYYAYYLNTSINEWNGLSFINVPVGLTYKNKQKGLGIAAQAGLNFSFMVSSFFDAEGKTTIKGYYPIYHVVLYNIENYDFITDDPVDTTGDWNLNQFNLSAFFSLGILIPAGENFTIFVGPYFTTGLTDLKYNKVKHPDDFLSISGDPGKLTTRGFGLRIELLMEL